MKNADEIREAEVAKVEASRSALADKFRDLVKDHTKVSSERDQLKRNDEDHAVTVREYLKEEARFNRMEADFEKLKEEHARVCEERDGFSSERDSRKAKDETALREFLKEEAKFKALQSSHDTLSAELDKARM